MLKEIETFTVNGIKVANIHNKSPIGFLGVFCSNGFIFESASEYGVAHFAEHMFFKGTDNRTWKQINRDFASIGSNANAYTTSDEVCYFVTTMNDKIEKSASILMDLFFNSAYRQEEIEKEKNVITEEKKMYDDDPSSDFANKCGKLLSIDFGHDAIGSLDEIQSMTREKIVNYLNRTLGAENMMVVFCGDMPSDKIKSIMEKLIPTHHSFIRRNKSNSKIEKLWNDDIVSSDKIKLIYEREGTEQSQVIGMFDGLSSFDTMKQEEIVLLSCLGGGDYSMMYERLREELGLCYALGVGNDIVCYPHMSVTRLFGMVEGKDVLRFIDETDKLFNRIKKDGIDKELFDCAKNSVSASILRSVETSRGKAGFLMRRVFFDNPITIDEYIEKIQGVTIKNCNLLAEQLLNSDKVKWAAMVNDARCLR